MQRSNLLGHALLSLRYSKKSDLGESHTWSGIYGRDQPVLQIT